MSVYRSKFLRATALFLIVLLLFLCTACRRGDMPDDGTPSTEITPPEVLEPTPPEGVSDEDERAYETAARTAFDGVPVADAADFSCEVLEDGGVRLTAYHGNADKLQLPDTVDGRPVRALGDRLFADRTTLTALYIPDSVCEIGASLLSGCRTLQLLRLPQLGATRDAGDGHLGYLFGGSSARDDAFRVPSSLDTVILSERVTEIPSLAFFRCSRVRMVILPETLTRIGDYAFSGCSQLHYAPLPASLTTLGAWAFEDCAALVRVRLPEGLESVGLGALAGCTSLRELSLPFFGAEPGATASTHLGYLFGAEAHTWNASAVPESLVIVSLLSGDVPDNAFYGCRALARVTLPENCTRIGVRAFLGCTALQEVTLPDGVQSVGELAFARCTTLCRVTWGDSLQSLGMQAFLGCTNLTEITLPDALASLANATFSGCSNLRDLTLGSAMREVGTGAFHGCVSLSSLTRADASLALNVGEDNEPLLRLLSSRP